MNNFYRISGPLTLAARSRIFLTSKPEWWIWLFSILAWMILIFDASFPSHFTELTEGSNLILCLPDSQSIGETFPGNILKQETNWNKFYNSVLSGIIPWMLMICAMMFPLLRRSIRHMAFSVQKRKRKYGIALFLSGYILTWTLAGILFHFIPVLLMYISEKFKLQINVYLLAGFFFFLVTLICWLPGRKVDLMKCELTLPIRLNGWDFLKDSVTYGIRVGIICIQMCWIAMIGLMLVHHSIFIMLIASFILITERYLVSHDSKLTGYLWMFPGSILLILGMIG